VLSRIQSKTAEPKIDEVWLFDLLLSHEKTKNYLKHGSFHVIDLNIEFDKGMENLKDFPLYNTRLAKFFNADTNTCTGWLKIGDVETGAHVKLSFKTMPYSANTYWWTEPFLFYDMVAEITHDGEYKVEHLIKKEEVLQAKNPFVPLF
jgi:hypothetical protein